MRVFKTNWFKIFSEKLDIKAEPKVDALKIGYKKGGGNTQVLATCYYKLFKNFL